MASLVASFMECDPVRPACSNRGCVVWRGRTLPPYEVDSNRIAHSNWGGSSALEFVRQGVPHSLRRIHGYMGHSGCEPNLQSYLLA